MSAPLGVRTCPVLGCGRRTYVTAGGTVYARCLSHSLDLLHAFSPEPSCGSQQDARRAVPPVVVASSVLPVAVPAHRPAA